MEHITLFTKISPEEQELMRVCFCARETTYQNNETDHGIFFCYEKDWADDGGTGAFVLLRRRWE